jgi:hypothetical protein
MEFDMLDEYSSGKEDAERQERVYLSLSDGTLWEQA